MTWVVVQRGDGDFRGPVITNSLLTNDALAIERGRVELEYSSSHMQDVRITALYRANLRCGQIAKVVDADQGETWYGKVTGLQYRREGMFNVVDIDVEKPIA